MSSVGVVAALAATGVITFSATDASAWQSPTKHRYLTQPLQLCDRGTFYVGGAPKLTRYGSGPQAGQPVVQKIIGDMYVQFATPMVSKSWPLIIVHGSGYTGSCVEGTAGGTEGWADYTVRNGVPTYVVDQAGRGRSGFDQTVIHEGEALVAAGQYQAAQDLIPTLGGSTSTAWTSWFGHIVPEGATPPSDVITGTMVRHGAPALQSNGVPAPGQDPLCTTGGQPAHCKQLGRIAMEPEAPWAVDQAIKSRTGNGAPAGLGTVIPDSGNIPANAAYLALDAYKFNVPNTEATLPGSTGPNGPISALTTWTPRAVAELVEGLGGAVVATHSQSGVIGMHTVRVLKEHGKLNLLKGLIQDEGSCAMTGGGLALTAADFQNIPYLAFKSDYSVRGPGGPDPVCQATVDAIKAAGGKADYIQLDQAGWWQGSYGGPFGDAYVGPFAGTSHMHMIESNPAPQLGGKATNLTVMDVMLKWADMNISKPATIACAAGNQGNGKGGGTGAPGNGKGQGAANNNPNGNF
jgi:hypothetical protein